jgi:Ca2+-binding RTX toxin-like protein
MTSGTKPIVGTGADNLVQGTASGDLLIAAAGDDVLQGFAADDVLVAGTGNDLLEGGAGSDDLSGGQGADVFAFSVGEVVATLPQEGSNEAFVRLGWGDDVVSDFAVGEDHLRFTGADGTAFTLKEAAQYLQFTEADVDQDGVQDTVLRVDYVDAASGIHYTDPASSITLLGVSGASLADLLAAA